MERCDIATAYDGAMMWPAAIAAGSAARGLDANTFFCIHMVRPVALAWSDRAMSRAIRRLGGEKTQAIFYDAEAAAQMLGITEHLDDRGSPAAFARLSVPTLVKDHAPRVIYLDADTVSVRPLSGLTGLELNGCAVAAVRDPGYWSFRSGWGYFSSTESPCREDYPYFNSGVLLIDVDAWLSQNVSERAVAFKREYKTWCIDQDALNYVLRDRWCEVPAYWNAQTELINLGPDSAIAGKRQLAAIVDDLYARASILHFSGKSKPWRAGCLHPRTDRWWRLAREAFGRVSSRYQGLRLAYRWSQGRLLAVRGHRVLREIASMRPATSR